MSVTQLFIYTVIGVTLSLWLKKGPEYKAIGIRNTNAPRNKS